MALALPLTSRRQLERNAGGRCCRSLQMLQRLELDLHMALRVGLQQHVLDV
jgi:hypothetical protein